MGKICYSLTNLKTVLVETFDHSAVLTAVDDWWWADANYRGR